MSLRLIFLLSQVIIFVSCEQNSKENSCAAQQTCTSCLRTPTCVWCSAPSTGKTGDPLVRCVTRSKYETELDRWCPSSQVFDQLSNLEIIDRRPLSSNKAEDPVQIEPQKMRLRLRRGEEISVRLKYSQAQDYPVDLYYLMDLSSSMDEYRERLSKLGSRLAETMRNLTSNFQLGFGSFVDKVELPMTNTLPSKLKSPCVLNNQQPCAPPYGYKNQMSLTGNVELFKTRLDKAPVSGNLDAPEGGLDAMMQAMVCTDEIGWRPKARHLLVFSTDASFHIAGDGKLAGIVEPNDGQCHLDENGTYTHSLLQDYPSISQINRKAREHNINIIFAVTKEKNSTYQLLHRSISGTSVGLLAENSDVVALVSGEYEKLVNLVEMTDNATNFIDVRYFSKCLDVNGELKERRECGGIRVHDIVEFEIIIKALECPKDPKDWHQTLLIKPRGLNESLTIDLELLCKCPCDTPGEIGHVLNAEQCNKGNGDLVCGVCSCHQFFYGKQCECSHYKTSSSGLLKEDCKRGNDTVVCSGHGVCKCGVCDCTRRENPEEVFYGKYCECDNFSCKRDGRVVCGHGKCECGTCNCLPGWGGKTCGCRETNSTCIPPGDNSEICSGNGDCICGSCHCKKKNGIRNSGQYCEECPTCPGQRCEELKDCVECVAYNTGSLAEVGCASCYHQIYVVNKIEEDPEDVSMNNARVCKTPGDAGCSFVFKYYMMRGDSGTDKKIFHIEVEKERHCPTPVNVMGVAIGVIVGTVILGFLSLVIWKLVTMAHDRREFAKFERERLMAKWDRGDNPLYKQATSTFKNPTFAESAKH